MTLGATPFSIYGTYSPEQIAYVVGDAEAKVALIERAVRAALQPRGGHRRSSTCSCSRTAGPRTRTSTPSRTGARSRPRTIVTLIYTSGTTGPPKGVQLAHRNLMTAARSTEALIQFPDGATVISWLPTAHIAERMAHHYLPIVFAMTITACPNPREVVAYLPAVKPTLVLRRAADLGEAQGRDGGLPACRARTRRATEAWLEARATRRSSSSRRARSVPADLAATVEEADRELFARPARDARARRGRVRERRRGADAAARCSCSSTPSASRSPSCGACRRPAARAAATRRTRSRSAPSGRRRRASS